MTWWAWLLLWTVLVLGAGGFLFLVGRRVFRQAKELAHELSAAADRFDAAATRMSETSRMSTGPVIPPSRRDLSA